MNKLRNRYANIQCCKYSIIIIIIIKNIILIADDHSRVKLTPVEESPHDYINANFIHVRLSLLFIYFIYLFILFILFIYLFYLFIYLFIYLSIYLFIYLFILGLQ